MSEPAKCPFCGAEMESARHDTDYFDCDTTHDLEVDEWHVGYECLRRQITALQAENKRLKAEEDKYWGTAKEWEELDRAAPTTGEVDELIDYQRMQAENKRLREACEAVLPMLEACGYGGSNNHAEKRHITQLTAALANKESK